MELEAKAIGGSIAPVLGRVVDGLVGHNVWPRCRWEVVVGAICKGLHYTKYV